MKMRKLPIGGIQTFSELRRDACPGKLREYYDGCCFSEDLVPVYNTYGLLNHFDSGGDFRPS